MNPASSRSDDAALDPAALPAAAAPVVLIVDDERAVREVAAATLESLGLGVVEATGGREALSLLDSRSDIVLMIVDFEMPGMNGVAVRDAARRIRPDLPVLFLTGHGRIAALNGVPDRTIVEKPFRGEDLARRIGAILPGLRMEMPAERKAPFRM